MSIEQALATLIETCTAAVADEKGVKEMRAEHDQLARGIAALKTGIEALKADKAQLNGELTQIQTKVIALREEHSELRGRIDAWRVEVGRMAKAAGQDRELIGKVA